MANEHPELAQLTYGPTYALILGGLLANPAISLTEPNNTLGSFSPLLPLLVVGALAVVGWTAWKLIHALQRSRTYILELETALESQRAILRRQVRKRTTELRHAQLNEMRQLYRCAELSHQGVTLLHDLANQLTALTLEIESLQSVQPSEEIARAKKIIAYLESIVDNTRNRLHRGPKKQTFDIATQLTNIVSYLRHKAAKAAVTIEWQPPTHPWLYKGDPTCLSQVVVILVNNAIDAYGSITPPEAAGLRVAIGLERTNSEILIKIIDWGKGIKQSDRRRLFRPLNSTKKAGLGLGLFIAKQTVEDDFGGNITLSPAADRTEFVINLPLPTHSLVKR